MNSEILKSLLDRPVVFHPIFARLTGSVKSGLLLAQAVYWSSRTSDPDGWLWKSQEEWWDETALRRREQETARRRLRRTAFWEENYRRLAHKMYFRVDFERLAEALESYWARNGGIRHSGMAESAPGWGAKRHSKNIEYREYFSYPPSGSCPPRG